MMVDSHARLFSEDLESYPHRSVPAVVRDVVANTVGLSPRMGAASVDRAVTISPSIYLWNDSYTTGCLTDYREWLATAALVDPKAADGAEIQRSLVSKGASRIRSHGRLFNDMACDEPSPIGGGKGSCTKLTP